MGFGASNSSTDRVKWLIVRLRKATAAWTARFHQTYSASICQQASAEQPVLDALQIPDLELLRRIGRGSYGEVCLVRNIVCSYRAVTQLVRTAFRHEDTFERELFGLTSFEPTSR